MHNTQALNDIEVYELLPPQDLWIYDKLIVAKTQGLLAGHASTPIPKTGSYIIRPITNLSGMSVGAYRSYLEGGIQADIRPGFFWCEDLGASSQISIDYEYGDQVVAYEGYRSPKDPLHKFNLWRINEDVQVPIPKWLLPFVQKYSMINIEMIEGYVVEVHLRSGHDDTWSHAIPIWANESPHTIPDIPDGYHFIVDYDDADGILDQPRLGYMVK